MASVRAVRNRAREIVSHRIEVKRTYTSRETGRREQIRWSRNREVDPRMTARENEWAATAMGLDAEHDLDEGIHPEERYREAPTLSSRGMTIGDWVARWRVDRGLAAESQKTERSHLDIHILPTWRDVPFEDEVALSRLTVQQWVNRMPGAPRSVGNRYGTFVKLINDAIDEPTVPLSKSPCVRIKLPTVEPTGRRALTEAEVAALAKACGVHETLIWTLAFTGCRISELLSRDVGHVRPLTGIELPPATRRRGEKAAAAEQAPATGRRRGGKTPAAIRSIALCGSHREALRTYVGDRSSGPLFVGSGSGRKGGQPSRPTYSAVWKRIYAACERLGVEEPWSPHWLRHTLETWLVEDGCAQIAIDEMIGHKPKGIQAIYTHVTPAMRAQILAALERRWLIAHGQVPDAVREAR